MDSNYSNNNEVHLAGRITEPRITKLPSGFNVARFSLATNRQFKNSAGKFEEDTTWHNVTLWLKENDARIEKLRKGVFIDVSGAYRNTKYTTFDGEEKTLTTINCNLLNNIIEKNEKNDEKIDNVNDFNLVGNICRDAVVHELEDGNRILNYSVAVNEKFKKAGRDYVETTFINCKTFLNKDKAEESQNFKKGAFIRVNGYQKNGQYVTQAGEMKYTTSIVTREAVFMKKKQGNKQENESAPKNKKKSGQKI